MRKTQIFMNKPVYLGLSILDLSKTAMYEFWYGYVKPKYGKNAKLLYRYRQFYCSYINKRYYKYIAEDVETRFDTCKVGIRQTTS